MFFRCDCLLTTGQFGRPAGSLPGAETDSCLSAQGRSELDMTIVEYVGVLSLQDVCKLVLASFFASSCLTWWKKFSITLRSGDRGGNLLKLMLQCACACSFSSVLCGHWTYSTLKCIFRNFTAFDRAVVSQNLCIVPKARLKCLIVYNFGKVCPFHSSLYWLHQSDSSVIADAN